MEINVSKAIKYFYPNPALEQVYLEAVANALDAGATAIKIEIAIESFDKPESFNIDISDNGEGFTDTNFDRFSKLMEVEQDDHKGLGRLVYLYYFHRVRVTSVYSDYNKRVFTFAPNWSGQCKTLSRDDKESGTKLEFRNFIGKRIKSYDYLRPESIKQSIIKHFLPRLCSIKQARGSLRIDISLTAKESNPAYEFISDLRTLHLSDVPDLKCRKFGAIQFDLFQDFEVCFDIKKQAGSKTTVVTALCVDERMHTYELLSGDALPSGLQAVFLFKSDYFKGRVDASRQNIVLPEGVNQREFKQVLRHQVALLLNEFVPEVPEQNAQQQKELETRYPHLAGYFESEDVGLIRRGDLLEEAQRKYFDSQKQILECDYLDDQNYEKAMEVSSRLLAEYILYRSKIIQKLKDISSSSSEADIHNLIAPQYEKFQRGDFIRDVYRNNAWLLDDRYMSYSTILSEKRMEEVVKEITLSSDIEESGGRPDITLIFSAKPQEGNKVDVVVVELKKQTDDEAHNMYAINQLMQRAEKLAKHEGSIQRIWYYAIVQISDTLAGRLQQMNWTPLFSHGKVFYQEYKTRNASGDVIPTPTYVVSFDAIVSDAEIRNSTFLNILKEGILRHTTVQDVDVEHVEAVADLK